MRVRKALQGLHEWLRLLEECYVIVPLARWTPLRLALTAGWCLAALELSLPTTTSRQCRGEIRVATGQRGLVVFRVAHQRLAAHYYELTWLTRMQHGRELTERWVVRETNRNLVEAFLESGALVLATAHFSVAGLTVIQQALPRPFAYLASDDDREPKGAADRRAQLVRECRDAGRLGQLGHRWPPSALFVKLPAPGSGEDLQERRAASVRELLRRLRRQEVVLIRIDASWDEDGALIRPFAGQAARPFARGAARLARIAHCPLIPVASHMDGRTRTVYLEWFAPILARPGDDPSSSDDRVMHSALDSLEGVIRRFPSRYLHTLGADRVWFHSDTN